MRLGVPIWQGRVSPVFDVAGRMLLVDADSPGAEPAEVDLGSEQPRRRAEEVSRLGVDVLICGAISRPLEWMLVEAGIEVRSGVCGPVDEVVSAYRTGTLDAQFRMPGCCGGMGGGRQRRRAGRGGQAGPGGNVWRGMGA
jgi:predicted Fe-Mo cluster-binding NifX family protein